MLSDDPDAQVGAAMQLAREFANEVDPVNPEFSEKVHGLVDDVILARIAYDQAALKLARAILPDVEREVSLVAAKTSKSDPSAN